MINSIKLSDTINRFRNDDVDIILLKSIADEYREYPQYIIKYVSVYYHREFAKCVVKHITECKDRKCELIECLLSAHNIKMCDHPNISNIVCVNGCECYTRKCWKNIYVRLLMLINSDTSQFLQSFNVYNSLTILVSKTDVLDDHMFNFVNLISKNPKNWKYVIRFISDAELFGSNYGDIIFMMRDLILENDKLDDNKKNKYISEFQNRAILISLLRTYNDYHKNVGKISKNIYISNISVAKNVSMLRHKNINCIVTLTKKLIFRVSGIEYEQIMIDDIGSVDFIKATLGTVNKVIDWTHDNKNVLVHCYKGLSRSVCFVILVLIHQGLTFEEAHKLVHDKKHEIDPNPEFIRQIIEYCEKQKIVNHNSQS